MPWTGRSRSTRRTPPRWRARSDLEMLRIAARDLLGLDSFETVGAALADLAQRVLDGAPCCFPTPQRPMAVIGMGKLGGRELNYASDVDVLFVTGDGPDEEAARHIVHIAQGCFRIDVDLRPEGRAGPLTRSLDSYEAYWARWAATWEFQALLKARPVAGDGEIGAAFESAAARRVWEKNYSADELAAVRSMKARTEGVVARRGLLGREIKRGPGGIRDIEFAVQLLQLVHGRQDAGIRARSTLGALDRARRGGVRGRRGCPHPGRCLPLSPYRGAPAAASGRRADPFRPRRAVPPGAGWRWFSDSRTTHRPRPRPGSTTRCASASAT